MKGVMFSLKERALTLQGTGLRQGVPELSVGHKQEVRDTKIRGVSASLLS